MIQPQTNIDSLMIEKYTKQGFWKNKTLYDYFKDILEKNPDKIAIVDGDHRLSFRELDSLSNNLTRSLRDFGIKKGDVVSFQLPNWSHAAVLNIALTKLGTIVNPIITIYKEREVKF